MANVKISQLPSLTTMTDAAEIPVVAGGVTYQITGANLTNYFGGAGGGLPIANGNSIINIATSNGNVTIQAASISSVWTFGTDGALTLPHGASLNDTSGESVSFGQYAGLTSQDRHAVAVGGYAGSQYQGEDSIAIGYQAGNHDQQRGVAIGYQAGVGGTLYKSVNAFNGGSGPATTYSDSAPPNSSRLYVASTTNIIVNQRVFGNNIQANTVVTDVISGEDRVDISLPYTAAMSNGDPLTFVGLVIGLDNSTNVTYGMRVTGTDIPTNTFVQSTGCSTVTLNQYPTAPLVEPAGLQFDIGQGQYATAVGYRAGSSFQADGAVAVGYEAGGVNQNIATVAVGNFAGYSNQGNNSVAIGSQAGQGTQSANAVAIGGYAGTTTQGVNAVAVGYKAGNFQQQPRAVAIGEDAGFNAQGEDAVAIGQKAGQFNQGLMAIAIGNTAGQIGQQNQAVAIGYGAGNVSQQYAAVAIGANAASYNQGSTAVAIGHLAGNTSQGASAVAVGDSAGYNYQSGSAVAVGVQSGYNYQSQYAVAIGSAAGQGQGYSAVYQSGTGTAITITPNAYIQIGQRITGLYVPADTYVVDIVGASLTLSQAIIGTPAVDTVWTAWGQQGEGAVAIGQNAALDFQGNNAVAIGTDSGSSNQSANAVAIGYRAGFEAQGSNTVSIGTLAGQSAQGNNSIILNATGAAINSTGANTFTVAPVRNDVANIGNVMFYNATSKEITYGNTISVAGNVTGGNVLTAGILSATGNVTGNFFIGNGSQLTGLAATYGNANVVANLAALGTNPVSTTGNITGGNITLSTLVTANSVVSRLLTITSSVSNVLLDATSSQNILVNGSTSQYVFLPNAQTLITGATYTFNDNSSQPVYICYNDGTLLGTLAAGGLIEVQLLTNSTSNGTWDRHSGIPSYVGWGSTGLTMGNGNITGATIISASANVTGGNVLTGGLISATGNITGGNVLGGANVNATTHTGTTVSVSANITGGNILTGGLISATGNITGGNLTISGNTATITTANYSVGYLNIPQISFAANATAALVDSGKHYYTTSASNLALTLADNSAVSWPVGTALSIVNRGTANVTVAPAAGVSLYLAGNSSSANRVVTTYGMATVMNVAANVWMINGTVV